MDVGDFFDGTRRGFNIDASFKPNGHLAIESQYEFNRIELPAGSFNASALATRVAYSFSTILFAKLFAQWNSEDDVISTNFLLNYIYRPGSDFYLVFNQIYDGSGSTIDLTESTVRREDDVLVESLRRKTGYVLGIGISANPPASSFGGYCSGTFQIVALMCCSRFSFVV